MNIYQTETDDFLSDLRQWLSNNPLDLSKLPHTKNTKKKEYHPMYGLKHTEETKERMSLSHSGEKNHMFGKKGKDNPNYGRVREDLKRINKSRAGRTVSEETKHKQSVVKLGVLNPMHGRKHKQDSKLKMSKIGKDNPAYGKKYPQEKVTCQYCGTIGGKGLMKRYHGENCKNRNVS